MNIVTIGTTYVDIKGYPHMHFVPTGRNVGDIKYFHGGVARNVAEDVAALGENSIFVSLTDESGVALDVVKHLQAVNVNTEFIKAVPDGMGTWMAIFDNTGDLAASISKRPRLEAMCEILQEQGKAIFSKADAVLLEMDIDEIIVAKAMEMAEVFKVPVYGVISNIHIAMERMAYIKKTACFICNRQEAGILFNANIDGVTPEGMLDLLGKNLLATGMQAMVTSAPLLLWKSSMAS